MAIVARSLVLFPGAAQQQNLVVHRKPEEHAEHDQRDRRLDRAGREPEPARQVPLLKDPHQRAIRGGDGEEIHDDRLERQEHRAEKEEQHHVGHHHDEADHDRRGPGQHGDEVEIERRLPGDEQLRIDRRMRVANRAHERPRLVAVGPE